MWPCEDRYTVQRQKYPQAVCVPWEGLKDTYFIRAVRGEQVRGCYGLKGVPPDFMWKPYPQCDCFGDGVFRRISISYQKRQQRIPFLSLSLSLSMGRTGERPYEDIVRNGPLQDRKRTLTRNQISQNFDHGLLVSRTVKKNSV